MKPSVKSDDAIAEALLVVVPTVFDKTNSKTCRLVLRRMPKE